MILMKLNINNKIMIRIDLRRIEDGFSSVMFMMLMINEGEWLLYMMLVFDLAEK